MAKRKYYEYKNDPTIKTPAIAWLSDRYGIIYSILAIFSILALFVVYSRGYDALKRISTEPVAVSPYMEVSAVNSTGLSWAESLIREKPENLDSWEISETMKPQNIVTPKDMSIASENVSTSLLSTFVATGSSVETRIHVYGSGQAAQDFNRFTTLLSDRTNIETTSNDLGSAAVYDNGFYITMGDAIISVVAPDNDSRNELLEFYSSRMSETLQESGCYDLTVSDKDALRSFFYDDEAYEGLKETTTIETQVNVTNVPHTQDGILNMQNIDNPDATVPESPLPADFPELPENDVSQPSIPDSVEDKDNFTKDAVYNIADTNGPGCGWEWSGQKSPVYDDAELQSNENITIVDTQNEVDTTAQEYVDQKIDYSMQVATVMPQVNSWNEYANQVNDVHERWTWLKSEREKLRQPWQDYVDAYNEWLTFDDRKKEATDTYNEELQKCIDQQDELLAWEEEWGDLWAEQQAAINNPVEEESVEPTEEPTEGSESATESPTASPEPEDDTTTEDILDLDIPEKPAGCSTMPDRPAIVDQAKPAEPQAPDIPEGVTIPDSWEKP